MGGSGMTGYLTHLQARLRAVVRDPFGMAVLLAGGALTVLLWPGPMPPSGPELLSKASQNEQSVALLLLVFWLFLWPALSAIATTGRAVASDQHESLFLTAHPALPVGPRARALANATLVMLFVVAARVPFLVLLGERLLTLQGGSGPYPGDAVFAREYLVQTLLGMVTMAPPLVAWVCPSRSVNWLFSRVAAVVGAEVVAMWLGLLAEPVRHAATCGALVLLQLLAIGREWQTPIPYRLLPLGGTQLVRPPRAPHVQLLRDFWLRPMPAALAFLAAQVALVAIDHLFLPDAHLLGDHGPGLLYFGSTLTLSLALGFVVLRPMASSQVVAGVLGKTGYRPGDFVAAYSVLPVRRESVLRGVYLHGLLSGAALWVILLATAATSSWLRQGAFALVDGDGDPIGRLFVPAVAVMPCIAGLLTAGAAGRRRAALLAGACMVALLHGHLVLLMLRTPVSIHALTVSALAALGGLPALRDLLPPARTTVDSP